MTSRGQAGVPRSHIAHICLTNACLAVGPPIRLRSADGSRTSQQVAERPPQLFTEGL
jgi:hypothetical protein